MAENANDLHTVSDVPGQPVFNRVRIGILLVSIAMAFMLYLHRLTLGEIIKYESFQQSLGASRESLGKVLGAFFFTYALFQIPAGWASDRFGGRKMLTGYILAWSILTGLTGLVTSVSALLVVRLACGVAQAGAYPTSAAIVRRWFTLRSRASASGAIAMGGRIGGATSAVLTAWLISRTDSWRVTLVIFSVMGIATSLLYWWLVRDRPGPQWLSQQTELDQEVQHREQAAADERTQLSEMPSILWACATSRSLWLGATIQFCVNIGWAFLATWLPTYLSEAKGLDKLTGAKMVTIILACGIPGQLVGGLLSDWAVREFGLRWGRILPVVGATLVAGVAYITCAGLDNVWAIVVCCGIVSAMTDIQNPSFWAFTQDVGGKNTATILGWCNMWGNWGAALSAVLVPYLMSFGEKYNYGTAPVFMMCGSAYFACAIAAFGINPTRPILLHVDERKLQ